MKKKGKKWLFEEKKKKAMLWVGERKKQVLQHYLYLSLYLECSQEEVEGERMKIFFDSKSGEGEAKMTAFFDWGGEGEELWI